MYRTAVVTVFLASLAIMAIDFAIRIVRRRKVEPAPENQGAIRYLRILVNVAGLITLLAVAYTGFTAVFDDNQVMTGDRLIWHVTCAPAFALAAVAVTIFWAHRNRFDGTGASHLSGSGWGVALRKFFFWCAVAAAIPTLLSILAAMFPIFGTDDQQELVRIHRYCAPLLASAGLLFAYFALVTWRERSSD